MRWFLTFLWILFFCGSGWTQNNFTERDRQLLYEIKVKVDANENRIEDLRDDMNARFNDMSGFLEILAAIFTAMVVAVIGFAFWDRRTIIKKAKEDTIAEIEKDGRLRDLIHALREKAKSDHELAQLLRDYHLL